MNITDTWEPKEEGQGLNKLEITRHVSTITITLSSQPLDTTHPGYQPPLPEELVQAIQPSELENLENGEGRRNNRNRCEALALLSVDAQMQSKASR